MSRLMYDYSREKRIVGALGGLEALEAVKTQADGLELPECPFCGGEAVVGLGSVYGQPTVAVECNCCHCRTVFTGPSYDYLTQTHRTMQDAVNDVARRWCRRGAVTAK